MRRHKNILVAVDGSEASFNALSESIRLARWSAGRITALVIVPPYEGDLSLVGVQNIRSAILGSCGEILSKTMDVAETQGIWIRTVCEQGEIHEKIASTAEAEGSDLIILGIQGNKSSLLKVLIGDTLSDILKSTHKDMLFIPDGSVIGWERILFVTTEGDSRGKAGESAIEVAASYGGSMKILGICRNRLCSYGASLYVEDESSTPLMLAHLAGIQARALQAGIESESALRRGDVLDTIDSVAKDDDIDLILTASVGKTGYKGLWTGLSLERMIYRSSRPVFVLGNGTFSSHGR